jgi:DNA-binding transcriptional MerR regulator
MAAKAQNSAVRALSPDEDRRSGCVSENIPGEIAVDAVARDGSADDSPMTIADVAREFGVTLRALRFYESKRLIAPQRLGSLRLYRRGDRARIALILAGRRLGFTLAEIRGIVGSDGNALRLSREQCVEQINLLERQKRGIDLAIAELRQIYTSFYMAHLRSADKEPR